MLASSLCPATSRVRLYSQGNKREHRNSEGAVTVAAARSPTLPQPLTPLIGRERDVAALVTTLGLDRSRLVTLTGPGGTGKTRLAIQAAGELVGSFPDGVWFVSLAPLPDPDLVLPTIAQALGLRESPGQSPLAALAYVLLDRRVLLVLDNLEQVVDVADLLSELLGRCPQLSLLVTSRIPLHLYGERVIAVPPLAVPDVESLSSPERLQQVDAVRLFVERAQAAQSTFRLTAGNARAIAEICVRLDGLPLAIELAAARAPLLSPAALVERLSDSLTLLVGGPRDVPARQQTLRATIAWSYDLLQPSEQFLFRALGVFHGGWTIEAAEFVAGEMSTGDVLEGHARLAEHGLIVPGGESTIVEMRYTMLETLREFALERLASHAESDAANRRHADWFWELSVSAYPQLDGPQGVRWLSVLDDEHDNLRAALAWLRQQGDVERGMQMVGLLDKFWLIRGLYQEGRSQTDSFLALPGAAEPTAGRAIALTGLASIASSQGEADVALRASEDALAIWHELGDREKMPRTLIMQGVAYSHQWRFAPAMAAFEQAAELAREFGDAACQARALSNLAMIGAAEQRYDDARRLTDESIAVSRQSSLYFVLALGLYQRGALELKAGYTSPAEQSFREALLLDHASGTRYRIASELDGLGEIALARGELARAARLMGSGVAILRAMGIPIQPVGRDPHDRAVAELRTRLGDASFEAAWAEGGAMSLEQAVAYALEAPAEQEAESSRASMGLTPRELEVLRLVATGLTDAEVAEHLFLSRRTVSSHLTSIYSKLGVSSRATATRFAMEHGLT
ncbi:MAG TPA: LuxR C-terminal-related transcriptional regulator [Thermomicrobiales bacterium]|nr:LuxR C-terminal-related transcriptional regulator [Thermomicrobiales bacterium]